MIQPSPSTPTTTGRRSVRGILVAAGLIGVTLIGVLLVAFMPANEAPLPEREAVPVNVAVETVTPVAELHDAFELTAVVEPEAVVRVAAEVAGRVERYGERPREVTWKGRALPAGTTLQEGQPIAAGDPLVHLNQELLQAKYDQAVAQFEYDQREYRRLLGLFERGSTSKTELDDAETRRDISRALLEEAKRALERTRITAPIDGIINRLPLEIGEYATPGTVVAEIVALDQVKVVVDVPERDVHYLDVGEEVEVMARMPAERAFRGEITYISELADEATRTTRVEVTVDNPGHVLRSGQIVRARLTRQVLDDVIMIPLASVIPLELGRVVYVIGPDGQAERRPVQLGLIKGRAVRVLDGLEPGDRLIVDGHRYVGPGQPVQVRESIAANEKPTP